MCIAFMPACSLAKNSARNRVRMVCREIFLLQRWQQLFKVDQAVSFKRVGRRKRISYTDVGRGSVFNRQRKIRLVD